MQRFPLQLLKILIYGLYYPSRHSGCHGIVRNILCYNSSGTYDYIITNVNTGKDYNIITEIYVITHGNRFGYFKIGNFISE